MRVSHVPEPPAAVARRVARRTVRTLIGLREGLLSGRDSGLVNVWEEVCVQVQDQHSVCWAAYDHTVYDVVAREVRGLPGTVVAALWVETSQGEDWSIEEEHEGVSPPYCTDDVVEHLVQLVYSMSANWSNRRIRAYLERHSR